MKMWKIICYILLMGLCLNALADTTKPKIAYINVSFPSADTGLYVGQDIEVKYSLTLLSGAKLASAEFIDLSAKNNVELKNKGASWQQGIDGVLVNTYIYKIMGKDVTLPPLRIKAISNDKSYEEEIIANGAKLQAIELSHNASYVNVIADAMEVVDYRVKEYDEANNIIIFQIESKGANLNTMRFTQYQKQGLESSKVVDGVTYGIYYVVLDKSIRSLSFDYFNLTQKQFVNITLPINLTRNIIDESGDIKPRNTFLIFKNLLVGGLIIFVGIIWVVFKKGRKITLSILVLLVLVLLYNIFFSAVSGIAQAGANISIIPTHNSTITEVVKTPIEVAIIGEYGDYYKVMIENRVGWVRKEYVSKN